jgi:hypothetical protein
MTDTDALYVKGNKKVYILRSNVLTQGRREKIFQYRTTYCQEVVAWKRIASYSDAAELGLVQGNVCIELNGNEKIKSVRYNWKEAKERYVSTYKNGVSVARQLRH